jgi:RimJ/RimL family protein N-acetyltransferase
VTLEDHTKWFKNKLLSEKCFLYFFLVNKVPAGQVRIEIGDQETVIGISIDEAFRGKSLSSELLIKSTSDFLLANSGQTITAYVKVENTASYKSFLKAGFSCSEILDVKGNKSYKLIKQ